MSNLSKKDYKKFNKKANRRKAHQEIDIIKQAVHSSAKRPQQLWQGMPIESLSEMLKDYQVASVEQNRNWDEEEIVVRFYKPIPMPRFDLKHWF